MLLQDTEFQWRRGNVTVTQAVPRYCFTSAICKASYGTCMRSSVTKFPYAAQGELVLDPQPSDQGASVATTATAPRAGLMASVVSS